MDNIAIILNRHVNFQVHTFSLDEVSCYFTYIQLFRKYIFKIEGK